ncbi:MAG: UDP-N-acetylmuramoyl-L-alanine--D-glutamate ligase [Patescibacteria group bacterium]
MQSKKEFLRERLRAKFFVAGKRDPHILILGLGALGGGVGVARFLADLGYTLTVTDLRSKKELATSLAQLKKYPRIRYTLGKHTMQDIRDADLIIKNPAVPLESPFIRAAKKKKIPITNDADLFLTLVSHGRIIGVTGTKGKTTTTLLIKHLLGKDAIAVGTPGVSFFDIFKTRTLPRWIVAEFSSFDLDLVSRGPSNAVITSLFADHLNRYGSFAAYAKAKMHIVAKHTQKDRAFVWYDSELARHFPKAYRGKRLWVSGHQLPNYEKKVSWRVSRPAIALAVAVARSFGMSDSVIKKRLVSFNAPASRLEIIRTTRTTVFIDDTTSTSPGAAAFSLAAIAKKWETITIIAGGEDKKFPDKDIRVYGDAIKKYHPRVILFPGSLSVKLKKYIGTVERAKTMTEAVRLAQHTKGAVVLLPGATSFNMFRNEYDRSAQFQKAVKRLQR